MESPKDSDEDSLARIMAKLNNKCQGYRKLFGDARKVPLPRPSIVRPKIINKMVVSTPMASKYKGNSSCSFDDMSSIANTPDAAKSPAVAKSLAVGKTPTVRKMPTVGAATIAEKEAPEKEASEKNLVVSVSRIDINSSKASTVNKSESSTGKEKEVSKNMTVITVNSSSSCHANSTLRTPRMVKQEAPSVQSNSSRTNKSTKIPSFTPNRSNRTGSVIEISSSSIRVEDSNLSKSARRNTSPRKDSTYDVVDQSDTSLRSQNKEKDATFDVPHKSAKQHFVAEVQADATFDVQIEATPKVSQRSRTNASCRNCLGCSSHDGSTSSLNRSHERIRSPVKTPKSKIGIDAGGKAKQTKDTSKREMSRSRGNGTVGADSVVSKKGEPENVTLGRRMSRSMSRINDTSVGVSVNKRKESVERSRGRKNETVGNGLSKKVESKSVTLSRRMSRSMSIINDSSVGASVNKTKGNAGMSRHTRNETVGTDSVASKNGKQISTPGTDRVSRSMSRINNTYIGDSVNSTKNNREMSRSRKNETIRTNSVVSKNGDPVISHRLSQSMSRIDDASTGGSVHDARTKRNMPKKRENMTNFGGMDSTLAIDEPRFQAADFTKSKGHAPSVEKVHKREIAPRPLKAFQKDATLKEISNVMTNDETFEKPRSVSRVPNRQQKRKQSPAPAESFGDSYTDEQETERKKTKIQKRNHERPTRREISVQVHDESLSETVKSAITPRKLTALGEIIPKVNALEKIVTYLAGKQPVTPQKRDSVPRRTICTQTGKSMEAQTSVVVSGSSAKKTKHSVGVGSDTIDNDEDDFFAADVPKIACSPNVIEYDVDNLPWRIRTPQAKPQRRSLKQSAAQKERDDNCPVKNIFDSLVESSDDDASPVRSSPRKTYRPSATNRKVFINKRKTTMNKRRSTQESLRKSLLKKRSRISLKRPSSLSSSSDVVDELQTYSSPVAVIRTKDLGNKEPPPPAEPAAAKPGGDKRQLSVVEDFSDAGFSDKENSDRASLSTMNSLAVKTPTPVGVPQEAATTNSQNSYVSKILSESPMSRNTPSKRRSKTKRGAVEEAANTPGKSQLVIRPPSPFEDTPLKNRTRITERPHSPEDFCHAEVSTFHDEISRENAARSVASSSIDSNVFHRKPSTSRQQGKSEELSFNEVSTTSELSAKSSSRSRAAKTSKQKSKDHFDPDEPTSSNACQDQSSKRTTKKNTNKRPLKNPPKRTRKISEDVREGSPTPSEISTNMRRSSRQRKPPKRLNEVVGFINCTNDKEYDNWLKDKLFKIPDVPKTRRRRTTKKSIAPTVAKNKPVGNTTRSTTNSTIESSRMDNATNGTIESSRMDNTTNGTVGFSRMGNTVNRTTASSRMTSFSADMSETLSSRAGMFNQTTKNDISSCSSKQNDTLQTSGFSADSDHFRIVSNNLQDLRFKSLKEDDNVSVAWTLASNSGRTTTGYLKLEPGALKPKQISAKHELSFFVFKGKAKIGVQDGTHVVCSTESFLIPKGMEYSILNLSKTEELLLMFHRIHLE